MQAIAEKIDELMKANLALHVARTSHMATNIAQHRNEFVARQEKEVQKKKLELAQALQLLVG